MPTYEYACTACGHKLDAVQKFTDDPLTECPECGGALRKVYGAVGIVLKGSGFYKTDSRTAAVGSKGPAKKPDDSAGGSSGSEPTPKESTTKTDAPASGSDGNKGPAPAATTAN